MKPSPKAVEAAWRIWKGEVTPTHATIQTVTQMAQIIDEVMKREAFAGEVPIEFHPIMSRPEVQRHQP